MKNIKASIIFLLLFLISPLKVFAGFGVSPGEIYNEYLKPGASYEQEIYLTRSDPEETLKITIEPDDSEVNNWIKFEPGRSFDFPKGKNRISLKAKIEVPENIPFKQYRGIIRIKAASAETGGGGVSVVKGARMEVNLVTTEINVSQLIVRSFLLDPVKTDENGIGTIKLKMKIENSGNIAVAPEKVTMDIQSLQQKPIESLTNENKLEPINPNETKEIEAVFKSHVGGGEYFANIKVYLKGKVIRGERLVLKVVGPGQDIKPQEISKSKFKLTSIIQSLNKQVTLNLLALLIAIVSATSLVIIFVKSNEKRLLGILFVIFIVFFTVVGYFVIKNYHSKSPVASQKDPVQKQTNQTGDVKGESVKRTDFHPLLVKDKAGTGRYYVYKKPDLTSSKIYVATENDKFLVIDEISTWYKIQTPDGSEGWLPKNNIKSVE